MSAEFAFHLQGAPAPEGQLDADHLLVIVASLKEVATKIGRIETDAGAVGRPPARVQRVAKLLIGLAPGSTTVLVRRVGPGGDALDLDLPDEQAFDVGFAALVEAIADDRRPDWVSDSLAAAAENLGSALRQTAPVVEFTAWGQTRRVFNTGDVHRETWQPAAEASTDPVTFVGRLFAANLNTHRFQVQDDVGNRVGVPRILDDLTASRLLGAYVTVEGLPAYTHEGRLAEISDATIEAAPDPAAGLGIPETVSLEDILAAMPGPDPEGGLLLTDEEAEAFFDAMGL